MNGSAGKALENGSMTGLVTRTRDGVGAGVGDGVSEGVGDGVDESDGI